MFVLHNCAQPCVPQPPVPQPPVPQPGPSRQPDVDQPGPSWQPLPLPPILLPLKGVSTPQFTQVFAAY